MKLYDEVWLTRDVPEHGLRKGDVAVWVDSATHPDGGPEGRVLEVFNAVGDTVCVVVVEADAIAPLDASQVPSVRPYERAT